jgi:hypothetical protein
MLDGFSKENRSIHPKVSASYVLSDEKFMQDSPSKALLAVHHGRIWFNCYYSMLDLLTHATGNLIGNTSLLLKAFKKGKLDLRPEKKVRPMK